ncbi:MAG: radical SAM protein [Lachnospiraceae bacterium]|jgi:putative pyruvate formate lyase activating enzyme|nr:radical SAM protein [Lachnospiraceae bacterium]
MNKIKISKIMIHNWEEPCISGKNGTYAIFFAGCNLKCVFCQNYKISTSNVGEEKTVEEFAEILLSSGDAHNIDLVSPSLYIPQIAEALKIAKKQGLKKPVIYNTNSYESSEKLKLLDGLVDVYLPDLKYFSNEISIKYSNAKNYFPIATEAILEMHRQQPIAAFDENGIIQKGIILRHLCLPGNLEDTKNVLDWIKNNLPAETYVSLMSQYVPEYNASKFPEINRKLTLREYNNVVEYFLNIGLKNGFIQELESSNKKYIPEF